MLAGIAFVAGLALALGHGTPAKLPGIALGWPLLLQGERAAAAAALVAVAAVVVLHLWHEDLPSELPGGVKWTGAEADREARERILQVERQSTVAFEELRRMVTELAEHVPAAHVSAEPLAEAVAKWRSELDIAELKDRIAKAIAELPEREKLVIALYYYENESLDEIAKVLEVSPSIASQIHQRAVMRLREQTGADPFPPGPSGRSF